MPTTAAILIIGDEILAGTFADQNASYLIGELRALGVELRRIEFIVDDEHEIADSVRRLAERAEVVFTSGGVGPTHDDVTIAGIARAWQTPAVEHPQLIALLERYYGSPLSAEQRRLALVPDGTELVFGDPRWPVMRFHNVHILPGVPSLFRKCFDSIKDQFTGERPVVARVYCACDETQLAASLEAAVNAYPGLKFGSYPRWEEKDYRVMITIEGSDQVAVEAGRRALCEALGDLVVRFEGARAAAVDMS